MKKTMFVVLAVIVSTLLTGCGSTQVATAPAAVVPAPDWVVNEAKPSDAANWYAVGSAKMPTEQNSIKMARMQARAELARTINTQVNEAITAKSKMTSTGTNEKELQQVMQFSTDALLEGSEQIGRYTAQDGTVYVLMALPKANAVKKLNESAATATGKSEQLFTVDDLK